METTTILNFVLFVALIALTMIFVGSEFAFVKARMSRIEALIDDGNKKAERVKNMMINLDYYLSACQLGITVTALGLGWIGESTFASVIIPILELFNIPSHLTLPITIAASFVIVTFLHVVVGELAPKTVAIQYAEKMALLFSGPLYFFGVIMKPFIWLMNGTARALVRLIGIKEMATEQAHSEEELKIIMTQSYQSGEINQTELAYMQNIFSFDERMAKDIMVPRTQMITLQQPVTIDDVLEVVKEHSYTRYPVTDSSGDKDQIVGFINVREFLTNHISKEISETNEFIHELPVITEVSRISDALVKMQRERVHIALIIDEYGGTAGMITMEDILEEIVGEIRDEFDEDEEPDIVKVENDIYHINGRVLLDSLEEEFGIEFDESEDIDTIGGWLQSINPNIQANSYVNTKNDKWIVLDVENHTINKVSYLRNYNKIATIDQELKEE
ncbi:hemolysin family protein [Phocicoccus pinnipedialis]|uniref:Magnesium and cobalt efflux protein CorC n=1 Tax=Phocicoccus pinnipedialis TaxID=110845 RepID=A0A6V7R011_9BACL|nr:hemolysin family protein [Jeotgalicoccus pinnipedialis]MBP1938751.1 CBS domain containing-hemolysin-like protein [Jeotgalicoccus pinnipedialis]CAD2070639.1 Magnesium and cobalt efflux protein CorC [Jeotgalicoccus pinnipedialis]